MANKPIFGSTEVSNFMVGDTQVDKVMVGSELLWNSSTELGCDPFSDGSGLLYDKLDNALVNECGGDITGVWDGTEEYCPDGLKDACACNFSANDGFISYDIATPPVSWTISMWFKIASDATATNNQVIFTINDATARWKFDGVDTMTIQPQGIGESIPIDIDIDTWYNISVVYDGSKYIHYLNNIWQQDFVGVNMLTTLTLGNYAGASQFLDGSTDEVRLFDRILTPEEIEILYNDGVST